MNGIISINMDGDSYFHLVEVIISQANGFNPGEADSCTLMAGLNIRPESLLIWSGVATTEITGGPKLNLEQAATIAYCCSKTSKSILLRIGWL